MKRLLVFFSLFVSLLFLHSYLIAETSADLPNVGVEEKLGIVAPQDFSFLDEEAKEVRITDFLNGKPFAFGAFLL